MNTLFPDRSNAASSLRQKIAGIALLLITLALAPQTFAQVCGPAITLNAEQWRLVGIPCTPATGATVGSVFGPSLDTTKYGVTWIAWKRIYDAPTQCAVASGPADCYTKLTLNSTVSAGDAFWIYSTLVKTLTFPSITTATPGPYFQIPAKVAINNETPRYYMFANPYGATVNWADLRFAGGNGNTTIGTKTAVALSIVTANVHYWNGSNTYYTRSLSSIPEATFVPKEAAWLEMLAGVEPLIPNLVIRVPKPTGAP